MDFPPLPVPEELLINDSSWCYPSAITAAGSAQLRLWSCADGGFLALITETGQGTSITNSIEHIWTSLAAQFGPRLVLVEHWPAEHDGDHEEHLDQVVISTSGLPSWQRIWPTSPASPEHDAFQNWMSAYGRRLLATRGE
jgi:hypothetical protein